MKISKEVQKLMDMIPGSYLTDNDGHLILHLPPNAPQDITFTKPEGLDIQGPGPFAKPIHPRSFEGRK